jgi:hypothetical protein
LVAIANQRTVPCVYAEKTEKWIRKMVQAIKKRGLTSEIKKLS